MVKNIITLLLAVAIIFVCVGCSGDGLSNNEATTDFENTETSQNEKVTTNDSELFSSCIVINGKAVEFPCKMSYLEQNFKIKDTKTYDDSKQLILIDEFGGEIELWADFNKKTDEIYCYNIKAIKNCNVLFPKNLKVGLHRSDVEDIFKGYKDTNSFDARSNYPEMELPHEVLGYPFLYDISIGSEYSILYNANDLVEEISYTAQPHIEDEINCYSESKSSEGSLFFLLPYALRNRLDGTDMFAILNYEGKRYVVHYWRDTNPFYLKSHDTSANGIMEEISDWGDDWFEKKTPVIVHESDLVRSATMFGKEIKSFTKSEISIGESKTAEYPVYNGLVMCGFGKTFLRDRYKILSADYTEIPQAVIEKFEQIVNTAAENLKY